MRMFVHDHGTGTAMHKKEYSIQGFFENKIGYGGRWKKWPAILFPTVLSPLGDPWKKLCRRLPVSIFSLTLVYWKRREPQSISTLANGIKYHLQKQCICQFLTKHDENSSGLKYLLIQIFPFANFFWGGFCCHSFFCIWNNEDKDMSVGKILEVQA